MTNERIHQDQPLLHFGEHETQSSVQIIMLHGRGATAEGLFPLAEALLIPGARFHMPQAARDFWYPQSAFSPIEGNQPDLDSAMAMLDQLVSSLIDAGSDFQEIVFGGFSQGACLAAEYAARNAQRYGGLFVFSGALIGPEGTPRDYPGSFSGMPAFIGGSDVDPWVPHHLLQETADVLSSMGAEVDFQTYPDMAHTVNQDEIDCVRELLESVVRNQN